MKINGFVLENPDKIKRVIEGNEMRNGQLQGGLGEGAEPSLILAHYDKLGGYITKNGAKVRQGSFWDIKNKKPFEEPKVFLTYNVEGETVLVQDGVELPGEVKAAVILQERKKKKSKKDEKED